MQLLRNSKFNIHDHLRLHRHQASRNERDRNKHKNDLHPPTGENFDSHEETASLLSGSSLISSSMMENSLFYSKDNKSIDKYMAKIINDEQSIENVLTSHSVALSNTLHGRHRYESTEQALNYSIRCNNLSSWRISSQSARIQGLNFHIIQRIIYREGILLRIHDLMTSMDKCYWKYCMLRIRESSVDKTLNSETLVLKRNHIFGLQNELSVGLAHLRSLSISIIDSIQRLRSCVNSELKISLSISVFWKDQNYLLKMLRDCDALFDFSSCRYWLGFIPNPLLIPPSNHDPMEKWRAHCGSLMKVFLAVQTEKLSKSTSKIVKRKGSVIHDRKDSFAFSTAQAQINAVSHDINVVAEDEWQQLSEYCGQSWTLQEIIPQHWPLPARADNVTACWVQNEDNPFFHDGEHNPLVIEASLGFAEVFPNIFLIPPLPLNLLSHCLRQQEVLYHERDQCDCLQELRSISSQKASSVELSTVSSINIKDCSIQLLNLKHRQERDRKGLTGISFDHVSSCYGLQDESIQCHNEETFHLTHPKTSDSQVDSLTSSQSDACLDLSLFPTFLIEKSSSKFRQSIQNRVDDAREIVTKSQAASVMRNDRKGRRELSRLDREWQVIHVIAIQRVFRGYRSRVLIRSMKIRKKWEKAVVVIQTIFRGLIAKVRFRRRQREHRLQLFFLRKSAVHRFRAAVLITKFIRRVVNSRRLAAHEPLFLERSDCNHHCRLPRLYDRSFTKLPYHFVPFSGVLHNDEELNDQNHTTTNQTSQPHNAFDDVEKQRFERIQALALIERVNKGKNCSDSRRSCRLIPRNSSSDHLSTRKFSKKDFFFLSDGLERASSVSSTKDVFVHPLSQSINAHPKECSSVRTFESQSQSRLSFQDHLSLKEEKRRQKKWREDEQLKHVVCKYFS